MCDDKRNGGKFLKGIIFGGIIGAGLALLFAPQEGEKTRKTLKKKGEEWKKKAKNYTEDLIDKRKEIADLMVEKAERFTQILEEPVSEFNKVLENLKSPEESEEKQTESKTVKSRNPEEKDDLEIAKRVLKKAAKKSFYKKVRKS